jgi:hypothetical protein
MKKLFIFIPLLLLVATLSHAKPQEVFSRSFMFVRPATYSIAIDQQLWRNFVYSKEGPLYGAMQLIPIYQNSRPREKVARYFLIDGKNELLVSGDSNTDLLFERHIRAEWVNLPTDFKGTLSVCPQQRQMGFEVYYNQDLKKFIDIAFLKNWSVGVEFSALLVENDINFCQYDMSSTMTEPNREPTIFAAFNQPSWKFAKIPTCKQDQIRPGKITFSLGRSVMDEDYFQLATRLSLEVPLDHSQNGEFLFQPYVGMNGHVGFGGAVYVQVLLNRNPERIALSFFANLDGTYYFRNRQMRTFDLKQKPWSRYMQYTRRNSPPGFTVPGVNVLTLDTVVRPFGFADFSMGWRINTAPFEFEIGYDVWGFGGEKLKLSSPLQSPFNRSCGGLNEFGIAGRGTIEVQGQQVAATANCSTIAFQAEDDPCFVAIDENDIDLCSAAAGSILNQKIHGAVGIEHIGDQMNGFAGFGFFFEFPQKNSSLATYGFWFKVGGSF